MVESNFIFFESPVISANDLIKYNRTGSFDKMIESLALRRIRQKIKIKKMGGYK